MKEDSTVLEAEAKAPSGRMLRGGDYDVKASDHSVVSKADAKRSDVRIDLTHPLKKKKQGASDPRATSGLNNGGRTEQRGNPTTGLNSGGNTIEYDNLGATGK